MILFVLQNRRNIPSPRSVGLPTTAIDMMDLVGLRSGSYGTCPLPDTWSAYTAPLTGGL